MEELNNTSSMLLLHGKKSNFKEQLFDDDVMLLKGKLAEYNYAIITRKMVFLPKLDLIKVLPLQYVRVKIL